MTRPTRLLPLVCLLGVLISVSAAVASPPQTSAGSQPPAEDVTATVRALDTKAYTLDVLTGVGHAVRLLRVRVAPECQIKVAGAAAKLGDLKAGSIVRMQYRKTPAGMLAEKIETVAVEAVAVKR